MLNPAKTYVFDIDGTICTCKGNDYRLAEPIPGRVQAINQLYEQGFSVVFYSARGMGSSGNNAIEAYSKWYSITEQQLKTWGVKYDSLILGKPAGCCYVDDKGVSDEEFFRDKVRP